MESARSGRSQGLGCLLGQPGQLKPQWSPPVVGGVRRDRDMGAAEQSGASMESARSGRSQQNPHDDGKRRLYVPQWSPPVVGGVSDRRQPQRRLVLGLNGVRP